MQQSNSSLTEYPSSTFPGFMGTAAVVWFNCRRPRYKTLSLYIANRNKIYINGSIAIVFGLKIHSYSIYLRDVCMSLTVIVFATVALPPEKSNIAESANIFRLPDVLPQTSTYNTIRRQNLHMLTSESELPWLGGRKIGWFSPSFCNNSSRYNLFKWDTTPPIRSKCV